MKKIALILMLISTIPTHATTMCTINDSVGVVLDPSITIKSNSYNATIGTWWAWSDSWTLYGTTACLSSNEGKSTGGTVAHLHDNEKPVIGTEQNGQYCWCRLTHPVSSLWAFCEKFGSTSECASRCLYYCSERIRTYSQLRTGLIGSVQPD